MKNWHKSYPPYEGGEPYLYFAFAEDALPPDFQFDRVRMEFKRQIKAGQISTPMRFDAGDGKKVVDLRDEEGVSCAVAEFSTIAKP